ncbi:MAG: alpha/beta fold hydrolase [Dermatophilaceae bacterium]
MTEQPATLLLLGGAGLPHWVWDEVRARTADVVLTTAPTLPRAAGTSLVEMAEAAAEAAGPGPIAVVAHSSGGCVAAELVARHPERVTAFLGLSAVIPGPGRSFVQAMPYPARFLLGLAVRAGKTRPPERAIRSGLASGLAPVTADRLIADFEPEPRGLFTDPCSARTWPTTRSYLLTTADRELAPSQQRTYARRLDADTELLNTGHLPMLEDPDAVTAAIHPLLNQTPPNSPSPVLDSNAGKNGQGSASICLKAPLPTCVIAPGADAGARVSEGGRKDRVQSLSGEPTTSKRKPPISPERRGRASWMAARTLSS